MKLKNVELFLQKKYSKEFRFVDNRNVEKPTTKLSKPLAEAKIAMVTSGGLHKTEEAPFDTEATLGDTSFRKISKDDDLTTLGIAHTHYDHKFIKEDINTVYPMAHFKALEADNAFGKLADTHYSICGFILDTDAMIKEAAEGILESLKADAVDAVILAPV